MIFKLLKPILSKVKNIPGEPIRLTVDFDKIDLDIEGSEYSTKIETKLLCWLLTKVNGNYIELGVNKGATAKNICLTNPGKIIYGVDLVKNSTMHLIQLDEQPTENEVAKECINEQNFQLILANSQTVKLPEDIGLVFIDADHTYEGVRKDTENVLKQVSPGTLLVWHDYHPEPENNYANVYKYINELMHSMKLYQIEGTWLVIGVKI
jgi:predicted O-methyltransferase YrrM